MRAHLHHPEGAEAPRQQLFRKVKLVCRGCVQLQDDRLRAKRAQDTIRLKNGVKKQQGTRVIKKIVVRRAK
jgi:hypothetical protein